MPNQQQLPIAQYQAQDLVFISEQNKLITDSLLVAKHFNKLHKNVIQKIENLDCPVEFASANFSAHAQKIDIGNGASRDSKVYQMTKDGFMLLVMGFTGKKAMDIKIAYINAFNLMEEKLRTASPAQEEALDPMELLCTVRDLNRDCRKLRGMYLDYLDYADEEIKKRMISEVAKCDDAIDNILRMTPKLTSVLM